jgi:hypothetical protein
MQPRKANQAVLERLLEGRPSGTLTMNPPLCQIASI